MGARHARLAGPEDAIDGIQPRWVVEPGALDEVSRILQAAHEAGVAVAPRGSGTRLGWGNPPERLDLILSTRRLNRVLEHAAGDLVVRVQAGARLADVLKKLAPTGQWLALDPPEGGTVGGIIAANASGPHRLRYGTARDLLIGITYLLPDGTIARAGGKVVKNVAGYDLMKLFTGSLGTLGLIFEAIFRLHPLPEASGALRLQQPRGAPLTGIRDAVQALLHSPLVPSVTEFHYAASGSSLKLLFEGIAPGVEAQLTTARELLMPYGTIKRLDPQDLPAPEDGLQSTASLLGDGGVVELKISHLPMDLPEIVNDVREIAGRRCMLGIHGHAALGITYAHLAGEVDTLVEVIGRLRTRLQTRGVTMVIHDAPLPIKQVFDVWDDVGGGLPLMRQVKSRFDPKGIMNPGRFVGRI